METNFSLMAKGTNSVCPVHKIPFPNLDFHVLFLLLLVLSHEAKFMNVRFLGIILRVLRLEVSVWIS
jgi:hypothetical protein